MGNWLLREIVAGCGLAMLVAGGYWQGRTIGRWQPLASAVSVDLTAIPADLGAWSAIADLEMDPDQLQLAGVDHYLARNYEHADTGEILSVLILSGPGGPISVHPPDVCFAGRGYRAESVITPVRIPGPDVGTEHRFAMTIFRGPESEDGRRVQLFWAWSDTGTWSTPANPRLAFARLPRVYKLYVSRFLPPQQGRSDVDVCLEFMNKLLPQFQRLMIETPRDGKSVSRAASEIAGSRTELGSSGDNDDPFGRAPGRTGQTAEDVSLR